VVAKSSPASKPRQLSLLEGGDKPSKTAAAKAPARPPAKAKSGALAKVEKAGKAASSRRGAGAAKAAPAAKDKRATDERRKKVAAEPELVPELVVAAEPAKKAKPERARVTAESMGEMQREISISEFFTKNRHLLGFDNASRALLTSVKEAVDNSLDACEEAGILPEIHIAIGPTTENRFRMTVADNGPGIVKAQVPKVFGKLLYGSKFHRLRQSRGQQGIGISAAGMYGQLTTGKPVHVVSKTGKGRAAFACDLSIDSRQNKPVVFHESEDTSPEWLARDHGTSVSIEMEATYKGGKRSLDEWVQQVAFANPHARIEYLPPGKAPVVYPRVTDELPPETKEIKPHPHGVELGVLLRMKQGSAARTLASFLQQEFSRVSGTVAAEICKTAGVKPDTALKSVSQAQMEAVYKAIGATKLMAPPTNCLAPIGEPALLEGLKALLVQQKLANEAESAARRKADEDAANAALPGMSAVDVAESKVTEALAKEVSEVQIETDADDEDDEAPAEGEAVKAGVVSIFGKPYFLTAVTRSPRVYRGNPFQVEAAVAYGGDLPADELATVFRFANRVPLLYQQGACAMTQSVVRTNWKSYDVEQARGALPSGPLLVMVHIASVWVPFTSEAKEAVAHYDEIIGELKFALQECGRRLSRHIRRRRRIADLEKKAKYIEKYIPHIGQALRDILGLTEPRTDEVVDKLTGILERSRKIS
jgi:DNA topoisomerase-6 subunit B